MLVGHAGFVVPVCFVGERFIATGSQDSKVRSVHYSELTLVARTLPFPDGSTEICAQRALLIRIDLFSGFRLGFGDE